MNHKPYLIRNLTLILVMLFMAGCTAGKADLSATLAPLSCPTAEPLACPTSEPLSCPTAPACEPTAAVQIPSGEYRWSVTLQGESVIDITFDQDEKCTIDTHGIYNSGMHYYNIKVRDQAHATYAVVFHTFDEGKTLADMQAYPKTAIGAPSWAHVFRENYVGPGTNSYYNEEFPDDMVYISCFVSTQSGLLRILDYGPVKFKP
jgi:hypothetical protein